MATNRLSDSVTIVSYLEGEHDDGAQGEQRRRARQRRQQHRGGSGQRREKRRGHQAQAHHKTAARTPVVPVPCRDPRLPGDGEQPRDREQGGHPDGPGHAAPGAAPYLFERWAARGLPQGLVDRLRGRLRVACGRAELPTAGSIDSQSVKAADTVGAASRGFDGGKKINGRKRHLAVDTLGLVLTVIVTAASVQDRDGAFRLLALLRDRFSTIALVWADGGYSGRLVSWAHTVLALTLTIVKRNDDTTGFVVLPRRWVVERTFGWLMRYRRLVRDYERRPEHHEAMVLWATVAIMTRQLARHQSGAPPYPRWGQPRTPAPAAPKQQDQQARMTIYQQALRADVDAELVEQQQQLRRPVKRAELRDRTHQRSPCPAIGSSTRRQRVQRVTSRSVGWAISLGSVGRWAVSSPCRWQ
ncbi:MAG: IS5 family transposase [Pseudonocardiaceae bacterium]